MVRKKRADLPKRSLALAIALVLAALLASTAWAQAAQPDKREPIHITSDQVEAFQQQRQIVFSGHVVAAQKDLTVRGDRMTVFYSEEPGGERKSPDMGGSVERIVVEGNVQITQGDRVATGKMATYHRAENKVVLTGDPKVVRNQDSIQGERITLFLDSEKSIVEGGPSGRVQATIYSSGPKGAADGSTSEQGGKRTPATGDQGG
jgi:lipopolysaccharide export system protein LptA